MASATGTVFLTITQRAPPGTIDAPAYRSPKVSRSAHQGSNRHKRAATSGRMRTGTSGACAAPGSFRLDLRQLRSSSCSSPPRLGPPRPGTSVWSRQRSRPCLVLPGLRCCALVVRGTTHGDGSVNTLCEQLVKAVTIMMDPSSTQRYRLKPSKVSEFWRPGPARDLPRLSRPGAAHETLVVSPRGPWTSVPTPGSPPPCSSPRLFPPRLLCSPRLPFSRDALVPASL